MATAVTPKMKTYSQPSSRTKKLNARCTVTAAIVIGPTKPSAAKLVNRSAARKRPVNTPPPAANRACMAPGRIPMLSNQPATPSRPDMYLFAPWAADVRPSATRRRKRARSYSVTRLPESDVVIRKHVEIECGDGLSNWYLVCRYGRVAQLVRALP
jgi:hypothetical protein